MRSSFLYLSLFCVAFFALPGCNAHSQRSNSANGTRIKVGTAPSAVELADFNRDGKLDAALAIGDVNNDGNLDLAFANHDTTYLTVLLGDGKGSFRPGPGSPFTVQSKPHPHGVVIADFNGDGWSDLATDDWQNNRVTVVFNDKKGGFLSPGMSFPVGKMPYQKLRAADVNKDGKPDIVTTNFEGGNVSVLLAEGQGSFRDASGSPFNSNQQPFAIAIGDLNGDGKGDIVTSNYDDNDISIVLTK